MRAFELLLLIAAIVLGASLALGADPLVATEAQPEISGFTPLPHDARVPLRWLPPGSFADDDGPSDVIFPPQKITLRFNHKFHLGQVPGTTCTSCHDAATTSTNSADRLLPSPKKCDACHRTDHSQLSAVAAGPTDSGRCEFCHVGHRDADGNRVAVVDLPTPNLVFNHQKHAARNIGCAQCHGSVEELELATRDQMPRMRGCLKCHQMPDPAARGTAKSECTTCHIAARPRDPKSGSTTRTTRPTGLSGTKWWPPMTPRFAPIATKRSTAPSATTAAYGRARSIRTTT